MVVQCPTCQSKFRIADQKVTDRGVRVRCTSCKNVFPVQKPGAVDLPSLDGAAARNGARPPASLERGTALRPPPLPAPLRPAGPARGGNGAPRNLDVDDLFGMAELTGDAPLGDMAKGLDRSAPPAPPAALKPLPNFDDIDIELDNDPGQPYAARPPSRPQEAARASFEAKPAAKPPPPPPPDARDADAPGAALAGPFQGMNLGQPATSAVEVGAPSRAEKPAERVKTGPVPVRTPAPEIPPGKGLVSSALTGLVGAALAIAVLVVTALSGDAPPDWLGLGGTGDVVATRVVSGLYDTASGKPVFYVRGRVENRGSKVHGPVRVTAELVSDGAPGVAGAAIAGAEPTAEDVWSLRSSVDVDRLNHALETSRAERKLEPGASLPFFAVISDPPADLQRRRLHLKVEPVDAWVPPPGSRKGR